VRRGSLCLAVSTGGTSAAAAKSIRKELEKQFDVAWGTYLRLLGNRRDQIRKSFSDPKKRRRILQELGRLKWVGLVRDEGARAAGREMDKLLARMAGAKPPGCRKCTPNSRARPKERPKERRRVR
jgi:precorrin-2 dehydrogenase/sirohydrochlorin ferrochelatase